MNVTREVNFASARRGRHRHDSPLCSALKLAIMDKEAYAVVSALETWASWIGQQPVLILTDHKTLQSWTHEILKDPMGPSGRRGRWHQKMSQLRLEV